MDNHVSTINIPNPIPNNPEPLVLPDGDNWEVIYQETGNLSLQPGTMNMVVFPNIVK